MCRSPTSKTQKRAETLLLRSEWGGRSQERAVWRGPQVGTSRTLTLTPTGPGDRKPVCLRGSLGVPELGCWASFLKPTTAKYGDQTNNGLAGQSASGLSGGDAPCPLESLKLLNHFTL